MKTLQGIAAVVILAIMAISLIIVASSNVHACNPVTFYGCSPEYKIAAQQQQFNHRQYSQRAALQQLDDNKAIRSYNKALERARAAEAAKKSRAKQRAIARHESASKNNGRTSFLTQTSDGTWVQTEIQRKKRN